MLKPDIRGVGSQFSPAQSFLSFIQAIDTAEGNLLRAVQCSTDVTTREDAIKVTCKSAIHRIFDWVLTDPQRKALFVAYMASYWAPVGADNDPDHLNANWPVNVTRLWT